jgi:glycosyltransferase involved in cell wall biosynthesis
MPSLWPEPFGKVGLEAAGYGIPVAAFALGGVDEWLTPGVNGMTAPSNPPTASGLAHAIVGCLADPTVYAELCTGALNSVKNFDLQVHVDHLIALFERVCVEVQ